MIACCCICVFLESNNDMHLKNFSLYEPKEGKPRLTPAYDMLNAAIVNPHDKESTARRRK